MQVDEYNYDTITTIKAIYIFIPYKSFLLPIYPFVVKTLTRRFTLLTNFKCTILGC